MNIPENKYPMFYADVQNKKRICIDPKKKKRKEPTKFNKNNINYNLKCPMNCIAKLDVRKERSSGDNFINFEDLIIPYKINESDRRRKSKKVEELIEKYSYLLYEYNSQHSNVDEGDDYILLKSEFEDMINEIRSIGLSGNYQGLISWLINRGFKMRGGENNNSSKLNKNKSLLLKVLYDVNKKAFLSCFKQKSVPPID